MTQRIEWYEEVGEYDKVGRIWESSNGGSVKEAEKGQGRRSLDEPGNRKDARWLSPTHDTDCQRTSRGASMSMQEGLLPGLHRCRLQDTAETDREIAH